MHASPEKTPLSCSWNQTGVKNIHYCNIKWYQKIKNLKIQSKYTTRSLVGIIDESTGRDAVDQMKFEIKMLRSKPLRLLWCMHKWKCDRNSVFK